jgi:mono/diheme cytochrome c family protein
MLGKSRPATTRRLAALISMSSAAALLAGGGALAVPGDPVSGGALFNARGCPGCHGVSNPNHLRGASLSRMQAINGDPAVLHPGGDGPWLPTFTSGQLRDLAAYLSSIDDANYSVSGEVYVFGSPSTKLSGVPIEVKSDYLPGATFAHVTGGDGTFSVPNLAAGDYTVKALGGGFQYLPPSTPVVLTVLGVKKGNGSVMSGTSLAGVDFAGQTTSAGQSLYVSDCATGGCHATNPADDSDGVLRGARLSVLNHETEGTHGGEFPSPVASLTPSQTKAVAAFLSSQDSTSYSVSGSLLDTANGLNPINDGNIEVKLTSSYLPGVTVKASAGAFQVSGLQAGDYAVIPSHVAYGLAPAVRSIGLDVDGVQSNIHDPSTFVPSTSDLTGIDFQGEMLEPFASGKAFYEQGCIDCHGNPSEVFDPSNPNNPPLILGKYNAALYGAARFTLEPDSGYPPEMNAALSVLSESDRDALAAYLGISTPETYSLDGKVEFSSTLTPMTPGAVAGATVTVQDDLYPETRTATTDEQGRYHLEGLFGGPKTVTVTRGGYSFAAGTASMGVHPFALDVSKLPSWQLLEKNFSGELAVDPSAGQAIYAANCSGCHGVDPSNDIDNILVGARLSVLRAIRIASLPAPVMYPDPPTEDESAFPYGTTHATPLNLFAMDDDELRSLAAYLAGEGVAGYTISGTVFPSVQSPDPSGLVVSVFSETTQGAAVLTDSSGNYAASGLAAGDYVVALPDKRTHPAFWKAFLTNKFLGLREFISVPVGEFGPLELQYADFGLFDGYSFYSGHWASIYEMLSKVGDGGRKAADWERALCESSGRDAFDPAVFLAALGFDARNLAEHRIDFAIAGHIARDPRETEYRITLSWSRSAKIARSGQTWSRPNGSTTLTVVKDPEGGLDYCGSVGDPLIALSDARGRLVLDAGSVDGVEIVGTTIVENGVLVLLNGKRPR